jgi:protoporphyrinogen oxidase
MRECIKGIEKNKYRHRKKISNFRDWISASFGQGIEKHFMNPYNQKVWSFPLNQLGYYWTGDRVAIPDLERIKRNISEGKDDVSWGPNNVFHFPDHGGTGEIWRRLAAKLPRHHIRTNKELVSIITTKRRLIFKDRSGDDYDNLITSMPLDLFIEKSDLAGLNKYARRLRHNSVHVTGIGLKGHPPAHLKDKCWMYFPENKYAFYRMTVFSNYSPNNVPDINNYWSLMSEVSETRERPLKNRRTLTKDIIKSLIDNGFIKSNRDIFSVFKLREEYAYPLPTIDRDMILKLILPVLKSNDIYSRGRFGLWKYEVGNQDHSFMQGVESVDHIMQSKAELTAWHPEIVNAPK